MTMYLIYDENGELMRWTRYKAEANHLIKIYKGWSWKYAGGGGGGGNGGGAGGNGGGGTGGTSSVAGTSGSVNTGGGGGGGGYVTNGGSGGSGICILSVPTASYSGITTGSPIVTTSGSNTIMTFTISGSYTT